MRKYLLIIAILTCTALAGCTAPNTKQGGDSSSTSSSSSSSIQGQGTSSSKTKEVEDKNKNTEKKSEKGPLTNYFGKVTSVVGNEVNIKLLAEDYVMSDELKRALGHIELNDTQKAQLESGKTITLDDGAIMGKTSGSGGKSPKEGEGAITNEDLAKEGINPNDLNNDKKKLFEELEFSGESKDIVIPSGIQIANSAAGKLGKLSDIKKGSIINVTFDKADKNVISVEIMR